MPVRIKGLDEFRRELRRVDPRLGKAFQKANKQVSERVADRGRPAVQALPSPGGTVAQSGIRPRAGQRKATIAFLGSNRTIRANILGAKSHWAWGHRIEGSGPWQSWLGREWTPEDLYGIGPTIRTELDGFGLDEYMDAILNALHPAFPD